jgi:hypothetical protein
MAGRGCREVRLSMAGYTCRHVSREVIELTVFYHLVALWIIRIVLGLLNELLQMPIDWMDERDGEALVPAM